MLQNILDQVKQFFEEQTPYIESLRKRSTCSPTCNHCCYPLIRFSVAEALLILQEYPVSSEKVEEYRQHWNDVNKNMDAWLAHKWPCIFMEDGKCSVYPVRPWVCRSHYVTSPPEDCLSGDVVKVVDITSTNAAYFKLMNQIPLPWGGIPQPLALRWAQAWLTGGTPLMVKAIHEDAK